MQKMQCGFFLSSDGQFGTPYLNSLPMNPRNLGDQHLLRGERKCDEQLAANESTHGLPGRPWKGVCVPFCGSVQRVCWAGWGGARLEVTSGVPRHGS